MTTIADITRWLDSFAPPHLAESWDNTGLLLGDPSAACKKIMTCLTLTPDSAREAAQEKADLVVSHHPILFKPTRTLRADDPAHAPVWTLARSGIALYSPHTAFDNTADGINDSLANLLGLVNLQPLRPSPPAPFFKVAVFCPRTDREAVLSAAFSAGAGQIGAYDECSYSSPGVGTFRGDETTHPTIGQPGRRESVREWRVEAICPAPRLAPVLSAIRSAHSYEEPAIDLYPVQAATRPTGAGRVGDFPSPIPMKDLIPRINRLLPTEGRVFFTGPPEALIHRLALVCGAGDDFLPDAHKAGADALLTGEARFHRALEAQSLNLALIVAGHHATERPAVEHLAGRLASAFANLACWPSRLERDPFQSLP